MNKGTPRMNNEWHNKQRATKNNWAQHKKNKGAQQMRGHNKLTRHNKQMENISQQPNNGGGTTSQLTGHNNTVDRVMKCSTLQDMQEHSNTQPNWVMIMCIENSVLYF